MVEIKSYLRDELDLEVKEGWSLFFVEDRGVDFVGYVFRHNNTRLRKTIVKTLRKISLNILKRVSKGKLINYCMYCGINSMVGWIKHCGCWRAIQEVCLGGDTIRGRVLPQCHSTK